MDEVYGITEEHTSKDLLSITETTTQNENTEGLNKPVFGSFKESQEEVKVEKEEIKEFVEKKVDPKNLLEESQSVVEQLKSLLEVSQTSVKSSFLNIKKLVDEESAKYDKMIVKLQLEQRSLLEEKEKIELERYNRQKEKESLGKLLADLIKEEKYAEADILQQKLSNVGENVVKTNDQLAKVLAQLNFNERTKTESYKDKHQLLSSLNELLKTWIVFYSNRNRKIRNQN